MSVQRRLTSSSDDEQNDSGETTPRQQQNLITQALASSAHLANLLPTGTLLAFQILTPIFTKNGSCDGATGPATIVLLALLCFSCLITSFSDSVKATNGQVYHGFATFRGLWLFDYPNAHASGLPDLSEYHIGFIDIIHAFLSLLVFLAVVMKDNNVVKCFYPIPGQEIQELLDIVPLAIGIVCSLLFVVFPTTRHGIGHPITHDDVVQSRSVNA